LLPPALCGLDCETLAALGAARVDDSSAAPRFHADQKPVSTSAANFRRLVSAFHGGLFLYLPNLQRLCLHGIHENKAILFGRNLQLRRFTGRRIIPKGFPGKPVSIANLAMQGKLAFREIHKCGGFVVIAANVDKHLINYNPGRRISKISTEAKQHNDSGTTPR
jgi:hypothetical protein